MSRPRWAKRKASGMGLSSDPGAYGLFANLWQPLHLWTMSLASFMAVGQWNPAHRALATRAWLPAYAIMYVLEDCVGVHSMENKIFYRMHTNKPRSIY